MYKAERATCCLKCGVAYLLLCVARMSTALSETSGLNLTGEYVGQTKKKVEEQLEAIPQVQRLASMVVYRAPADCTKHPG